MAEIKSPEELDAFLESEHERERENLEENLRLMEFHVNRLREAAKTDTDKESLKQQCEKIIAAYGKELQDNHTPYEYQMHLNEVLASRREITIGQLQGIIDHINNPVGYNNPSETPNLKISDLIIALQTIKDQHGDIECVVYDGREDVYSPVKEAIVFNEEDNDKPLVCEIRP